MLFAAGGVTSAAYRLVLLAHLVCVVVGFGGLIVDGLLHSGLRRRPAAESFAVSQAGYVAAYKIADKFLYGVLIFGAAAIPLSDGQWEFSQTWVSVAFALFVVILGLLHGVLLPARRRVHVMLGELAGAGGADEVSKSRELARLSGRINAAWLAIDVALVAAVADMIWKPGV
ncbi:MAG: hypothetical protein ACKVWR_18500 [Acidimicrobiales bacterium]